MNTTVETPRERALKDITAAAVCLEETEQTLAAGGHIKFAREAYDLREALLALAEKVRDA